MPRTLSRALLSFLALSRAVLADRVHQGLTLTLLQITLTSSVYIFAASLRPFPAKVCA